MIGDEADLALARLRAQLARQRMLGTMSEIRDRLHPGTLVGEVLETVRERGEEIAADMVEGVKERPGRAAMFAGLAALFLARKPIASGVKSLLLGAKGDETDGQETDRA